ncbi:MAG: hypothetical protein V4558_02330 [Gemmatimonadota bacterium]
MTFREATDHLLGQVAPSELAFRLGITVEEFLRARNNPALMIAGPAGWRETVIHMAEERVSYYTRLITRLRSR